jgi:hypothetical protein
MILNNHIQINEAIADGTAIHMSLNCTICELYEVIKNMKATISDINGIINRYFFQPSDIQYINANKGIYAIR